MKTGISFKAFHLFSGMRLVAALAVGLALTVTVSSVSAFSGTCADIRESVLRLHILANSDSPEDQALKLAVRDRILELDSRLFGEAETLEQAEAVAEEQLAKMEEAAEEEIRRQGYSYPVEVELCRMYFSTRDYESFTLPAGNYQAVRVTIGEGKGHNWWCVLYPPLCLPAAQGQTELSDVLGVDGEEIVTHPRKYRFSFALIELWEKWKASWFD